MGELLVSPTSTVKRLNITEPGPCPTTSKQPYFPYLTQQSHSLRNSPWEALNGSDLMMRPVSERPSKNTSNKMALNGKFPPHITRARTAQPNALEGQSWIEAGP